MKLGKHVLVLSNAYAHSSILYLREQYRRLINIKILLVQNQINFSDKVAALVITNLKIY